MSQPREPISAFIICFNEEEHIGECIDSVAFCDEVLVVDSLSTDRTVEIAKERGARVIERPWPGYKEQKAFALSATEHEWVLNLDADERISPELRAEIERVLAEEHALEPGGQPREGRPIGYFVNRLVYYLGRWWKRGGWFPEFRLRFFRKSQVVWGGVDPHEKPLPQGPTARLVGDIHHFTYSSMNDQVDRLNRFSSLAAIEAHKLGRRPRLYHLLLSPMARALKFYFLKRGYREGMAGFIIAMLEAYYTFMKYAKMWEIEFNERADRKSARRNPPPPSTA